jgi:hypothetical protein
VALSVPEGLKALVVTADQRVVAVQEVKALLERVVRQASPMQPVKQILNVQ